MSRGRQPGPAAFMAGGLVGLVAGHGGRTRFVPAGLAGKDEGELAAHVIGGETGGEDTDGPQDLVHLPGRGQHGVLGPEPGQGRYAGDGQPAHHEGDGGDGQVLSQPAHFLHVLLVGQGMDHGPGGEEQEGLEEGVREHVEDAIDVVARAHGQEHVPKLGDGRVGQDLLDVVLGAGDGRRQQSGTGAGTGHDPGRGVGVVEQGGDPGHEVHAGGDHGGGMDQGGDRGRAFHGVGEPDVQRDLGRLADGAQEQQECYGGGRATRMAPGAAASSPVAWPCESVPSTVE